MQDLGIGSRVRHSEFGDGVVVNSKPLTYTIVFMQSGKQDVPRSAALDVLELLEPDTDLVSMTMVERALTNIITRYSDVQETVQLHGKWKNGKMILQPGVANLQGKTIPIEAFFHKIVMLRDRVRVLEQKLNSNPKLADDEKIEMQQYITRIYGSLTTFNVLFKNQDDYFFGAAGKEE